MNYNKHNQGSVLLYSLLVISLITVIAITVSMVVVNELKLSSAAANGTMAYYAAESGIEKGLYTIKIERNKADTTLATTVAKIIAFDDGVFFNGAEYVTDQTSSRSSNIENQFIAHNDYIQADYYDVNHPLNPGTVIDSVELHNGEIELNPDTESWAEVSWTAWDNKGQLGTSINARRVIGPSDLEADSMGEGWVISNLDQFEGMTPQGYRMRVRALFGDLSSFTITPKIGESSVPEGSLPSQIEIKAVGDRYKFKQSLTATVPWKVPLFGLYDYVLFSEGELTKTIVLGQPVYSSGTIQIEADLTSSCFGCAACQGATPAWLADPCTNNMTCIIQAAPAPSYCMMGISEYFTLPISDTMPLGQEYYLSLRAYASGAGGSRLETTINDPEEGDLGLVIDLPSQTDFSTCTIPESFSLSGESGRTIKFDTEGANGIFLDWYQISSYKIFDDCE